MRSCARATIARLQAEPSCTRRRSERASAPRPCQPSRNTGPTHHHPCKDDHTRSSRLSGWLQAIGKGPYNLHPRIAKFPAERRFRPFKPRRTLYMYIEDDQALAQRSTPPTHASNVDYNSSCLLWIIYARLEVETFRGLFLALLLRLTIASFTSSLMT